MCSSVCAGPVQKPHCWFSHEAAHIKKNIKFSTEIFQFLQHRKNVYIKWACFPNVSLMYLKQMDALDESEELTELGRHLADLPVDPHLGKMVLNSIVLKCLDPVLTIVCSLAYKDPCK